MILSFVASCSSKRLGFKAQCALNRIIVQYSDIVSKILLGCKDLYWPKRKLSTLRSGTESFKRVVYRFLASHCSPDLFALELHPLEIM